ARRAKHDLVVVESPAKAKTIGKYLGPNFRVTASFGHVRDLSRKKQKGDEIEGLNIAAGWQPNYVLIERDGKSKGGKPAFKGKSAKEILAEIKREASKANRVYLATDPDREGESIAWHIQDELKLDPKRTFRIAFNEITKTAVANALAHAGQIDLSRVQAQEA